MFVIFYDKPVINFLFLLFAACGVFVGAPAVLLYLVLIKFLYILFVSIVISSWENNEKVLVETTETRLEINLRGIPVKESTDSLSNIHFKSERAARSGYMKLLTTKLIIVLGLLWLSITNASDIFFSFQGWHQIVYSSVGIATVAFIIVKLLRVLKLLLDLNSGRWFLHNTLYRTYTYYAAYTPKIDEAQELEPYLAKVFE